ncbi:hypothetical protein CP8484711_1797, partial [Chlamydia psittaci 84-8471/1]
EIVKSRHITLTAIFQSDQKLRIFIFKSKKPASLYQKVYINKPLKYNWLLRQLFYFKETSNVFG